MTTSTAAAAAAPGREGPVPFGEALAVWSRVAALSFGGPAGQIAVMQRIVVEEKRWVTQERFLQALNFCMLLPGPEAMQLATYLAWLLNGNAMAVIAGTLFVLPGFLSILALSFLYVGWQGSAVVTALFYGLKPAVLAVVVAALVRLGRRALDSRAKRALAAFAFVAILFLQVPYPLVIVVAATLGWWLGRRHVGGFGAARAENTDEARDGRPLSTAARRPPSWRRALGAALLWIPLWWGPVAPLAVLLGRDHVLVQEGVFFGKTAVVTFGGAYSVLAYVAQRAVETFHWLSPAEMLDGLGMAETTPGPLIQVVQFVGFVAAWRNPGVLPQTAAALLGSCVTAWSTFAPCFLWIFVGAPYMERLRGRRGLADALAAITATVVGVILQLAVWFALHTLFARVHELRWLASAGRVVGWRGVRLFVPELASLDPFALAIAAGAAWLLFRTRVGMLATLAAAVAAGALVQGVRALIL